jgi:ring-1,2-phenylacetyl-CoA epoxidase subunit PaaE
MQVFTLKAINLRFETKDALTISFKQPALKKIKYLAGQYLTLIFRINGRRYIRPYSFSSAPGIDAHLEVTIKRVPGGVVSNHIIDQLKIDDLVEVMEPMGDFVLSENNLSSKTHLVLWGAGSGITPLISIAKYALYKNLVNHVTLVFGNRSEEDVIFSSKITELKEHYNQFSAIHFLTHAVISNNNPNVIQGRINPENVLDVMQNEGSIYDTIHYICGPTGLKESVKSTLLKLNIEPKRIYSEDFEVVRDPAEFENIITRVVTIKKDGLRLPVEVVKGKSILEAGLDAIIDMSYSCQTGNCLICKGRLIEGQIKTIGIEKLPESLQQNECLLCSSFPLTDNIEIEID